jgi:hypothetical protein
MNNHRLKAGAAKVKLEYPENFFPHKSFRGRYFTGVHDDLYARSLYIVSGEKEALIISVELGDVSGKWLPYISSAAGVPEDAIFLLATHTHASPHADGTWPEDVIDTEKAGEFEKLCERAVIEAVRISKKQAQPARFSFGFSSCSINVNRDYKYSGPPEKNTAPYITAPNYEGISDKTMTVLKFEDLTGKLISCVTNYAVHSNVTFYQTWTYEEGMLISGDLAGIASRYVEERKGGVSLFTMGAAADQMPKYLANRRVFDKEGRVSWKYYGRDQALALADAQGVDLGDAILRALDNCSASTSDPLLSAAGYEVTLAGKQAGYPKTQEAEDADEYTKNYHESAPVNFRYLETGPIKMRLYMLQIGEALFFGIPAEIVTSIGREIRSCAPEGFKAIVATQCNGSFSYISDDAGYTAQTFSAVASHFMPGTAELLAAGVKALVEKL